MWMSGDHGALCWCVRTCAAFPELLAEILFLLVRFSHLQTEALCSAAPVWSSVHNNRLFLLICTERWTCGSSSRQMFEVESGTLTWSQLHSHMQQTFFFTFASISWWADPRLLVFKPAPARFLFSAAAASPHLDWCGDPHCDSLMCFIFERQLPGYQCVDGAFLDFSDRKKNRPKLEPIRSDIIRPKVRWHHILEDRRSILVITSTYYTIRNTNKSQR